MNLDADLGPKNSNNTLKQSIFVKFYEYWKISSDKNSYGKYTYAIYVACVSSAIIINKLSHQILFPNNSIVNVIFGFLLILQILDIISYLEIFAKWRIINSIIRIFQLIYISIITLLNYFTIKRDRVIPQSKRDSWRTTLKKLVYISWFYIIPLIFVVLIIPTQWNTSMEPKFGGSVSLPNYEVYKIENYEGTVQPIPLELDKSILNTLSYKFSDVLNIPITDTCFKNYGAVYSSKISNGTFSSIVVIDNVAHNIGFNGEFCTPTNAYVQTNYNWTTKYTYSFNQSTLDRNEDVRNQALNFIDVRYNIRNFIFMTIIIILGWMGASHLVYSVINDGRKIGNSDKPNP